MNFTGLRLSLTTVALLTSAGAEAACINADVGVVERSFYYSRNAGYTAKVQISNLQYEKLVYANYVSADGTTGSWELKYQEQDASCAGREIWSMFLPSNYVARNGVDKLQFVYFLDQGNGKSVEWRTEWQSISEWPIPR